MTERFVKQVDNNTFIAYAGDHERDYNNTKEIMKFVNEIASWCKETFGNHYETWNIDHTGCTFIIDSEEDIMAFKLRWL